jgi:hypothetical protein
MNKNSLLALAALFATLCWTPPAANAQEGAWRLVARDGAVWLRQAGASPREAQLNEALHAGTTVTTGADSRATIGNGAQRIVMSANSRMTLPRDTRSGMTRVLQDLGSILFQVDHRQSPHFRVETPLLAAIVKGTTFTVTVNGQADTVEVANGLVEVRANEGGAQQDVASGQLVRISAGAPSELVLAGGSSGGALADGSGLRGTLGEAEVGAEYASSGGPQNVLSAEIPSGQPHGASGGRAQTVIGSSGANVLPGFSSGREKSGDEGFAKFILVYLLASGALGFGFFLAVGMIQRLGRSHLERVGPTHRRD